MNVVSLAIIMRIITPALPERVCVMLRLLSACRLPTCIPACMHTNCSFSETATLQMTHSLPELATSTQSKETDLEVGRWGEELVYRFLLAHASANVSLEGRSKPQLKVLGRLGGSIRTSTHLCPLICDSGNFQSLLPE